MELDSFTDAQARLLVDSQNRVLLTILDDAGEPLHVEELADRLVSRDVTVVSTDRYEDRLRETRLTLHHERLPKLAESGLVEYDPERNVAASRSSPPSTADRETEPMVDGLVAHLSSSCGDEEDGVGVLEGREAVIRHGRRLADEAADELFCLYVTTDLLEDECIRRAENAIDRGVTMYVGSQNEAVRDLTRRRLPEATIWEPQLDWLNTHTYPRVGRLVVADREKVMLAVLEEPEANGASPAETALVGEGEENPLVVLIRDLLGPRLDHLDYQSSEFTNELPS